MSKIRMLRTETVATATGSVVYRVGEVYENVPQVDKDSLLGRGYAVEVFEQSNKVLDREALNKMTVVELRKMAQDIGVKDYSLLRKTDLIDILTPVESASEEKKEEKMIQGVATSSDVVSTSELGVAQK